MSYAEKIEEARQKAADITVNEQLSVEQLERIYYESGIMYVCHDGRIVDSLIEDNSKIIEVKFNDEEPNEYNYKYFQVLLESGYVETFHYHIHNPIPTEDQLLGLTWHEACKLALKMFYDKINEHQEV